MLTKKEEIILGINTDIISYNSKSKLQIIIFPGNPGIADFYKEFAEQIIKTFQGNCNVYIIGYAGFTNKNPNKHYTLQEEVEHKIAVIETIKKNWASKSRLVILGHSVGGWIAKEVVKKINKKLNPTIFLIFPFIAKTESNIQDKFSKLLENKKHYRFLLSGYKVFRKLPRNLLIPVIKLMYSHASETALEVIEHFFLERNHIPESIFYLGSSEFNTLTHDIELDFFITQKKSVVLFYCHEDIWAPISQLEIIKEKIPGIQNEIFSLINHDFCVNTDQCMIVAEKVYDYLKRRKMI